jgi:Tol biopolymer transport system component
VQAWPVTIAGGVATRRRANFSAVLAAAAVLLSGGAAHAASGNGASGDAAISADGRFVAFSSEASDLVAGDTNGVSDVFVRDRSQGTTERVSIASGGAQADGRTGLDAISADGRFVLMWSQAANLVAGDTNAQPDIFLRDRAAGTIERVSVGSDGAQADGESEQADVSDDGRIVAFASNATNLAAGAGTPVFRVYVRGATGATELVGLGWEPALSADGRYLAFAAASGRILVRDNVLGTTEEASVADDGTQLPGTGAVPTISADGRFVAFLIEERSLLPSGSVTTLYVRDRVQHTTQRLETETGTGGNPSISADGTLVAFESFARLPGGVFVSGTAGGAPELASVSSNGVPAAASSYTGSGPLSADGRFVAFYSLATNFAPGDANGTFDVFVRDRTAGITELVSVARPPTPVAGIPLLHPQQPHRGRTTPAATVIPVLYRNCTNLNRRYRHGVGKVGARDRTSGGPVTNFFRSTSLYNRAMSYNRGLDRDKDGIACEKR